jgi:hypothetical protein
MLKVECRVRLMDLEAATRIAEEYVAQRDGSEVQCILFPNETIEREFGWVFFYGPSDPSIIVAGNAPFIIDRKEGAIHPTGTAYPLEQYLESYDRVERTHPFAANEHLVILNGWKPGMRKILLTKLTNSRANKALVEAKLSTDEVLAGRQVTLTFSTAAEADAFCADAQQLGASSKRETHFH